MQNKNIVIAIAVVLIIVLAGAFLILRQSQKTVNNPEGAIPSSAVASNKDEISATPSTGPKAISPNTGEIQLDILSPTDNSKVSNTSVTVTGKTAPQAEVSVNESDIKADSSGNFSTVISLDEGENSITVVANDANGKNAEKEITVTYEPQVSK